MIKNNVDIKEVNDLLFAFAVLLTPKVRDAFYDALIEARSQNDPKKFAEAVIANIMSFAIMETVKRSDEAFPEDDEFMKAEKQLLGELRKPINCTKKHYEP